MPLCFKIYHTSRDSLCLQHSVLCYVPSLHMNLWKDRENTGLMQCETCQPKTSVPVPDMFYASLIPAETRPSSQGLLPADPTANTLLNPGPHSSSLVPSYGHNRSAPQIHESWTAARASSLRVEIENRSTIFSILVF